MIKHKIEHVEEGDETEEQKAHLDLIIRILDILHGRKGTETIGILMSAVVYVANQAPTDVRLQVYKSIEESVQDLFKATAKELVYDTLNDTDDVSEDDCSSCRQSDCPEHPTHLRTH